MAAIAYVILFLLFGDMGHRSRRVGPCLGLTGLSPSENRGLCLFRITVLVVGTSVCP